MLRDDEMVYIRSVMRDNGRSGCWIDVGNDEVIGRKDREIERVR